MKTCTKCHVEKEPTSFYVFKKTGKLWAQCKQCHIAECMARASADPELSNARTKAWRQANPEQWQATVRARQKANPEKFKGYAMRTRYRVDFAALLKEQQGLCSCCGLPMKLTGKDPDSVCVDHDRSCCTGGKSCGKCVRGLIHRNCNLVLGYAKDNIEVLEKAVEYLRRWKSQKGQ